MTCRPLTTPTCVVADREDGMKLLKRCRSILAEAEMKIQKLQATAEGEVRAEPFDSEQQQ